MASPAPETFHGWQATSPTSPLTHRAFTPKPWAETDVDIKITHCGVCASDLHSMRSGWGPTPYPCTLGHEIVGTAVRVGAQVRPDIKVGSRVGVGPQGYTCRQPTCPPCSSGHENYCPHRVATYGDNYADGAASHGGFADFCRHDSGSVFAIPEGLGSASAAVMLCAGATVFEPLVEAGVEGKRVGVVGLGGLGHLGVLFARALGARTVGEGKRKDALRLGVDTYVATDKEEGWAEKNAASLDVIVCTVSGEGMPLKEYLGLLAPRGRFCQVGIPEKPLPQLDVMELVLNGTSIGFSDSASPGNIRRMLSLAAEKGIEAWTETRRMEDVNQVVKDMAEGKARYRYVLEN
ncbi:MAG: putative secondary metabolism biosynthetic enzyme [Ramalina farinacea]|uniref:Secondary metabolism biosynthetic enzyme n=1 Tax=Ramalina farinacea TaxID=258253 RepID=A0AA43TSZ2_9LECA|nr:putative secondary metabolism biosynthetic enzyme [Ramalina farinacea]